MAKGSLSVHVLWAELDPVKGHPVSTPSRRSWSGQPWKAFQPKPYLVIRYASVCQKCRGPLEKGSKGVKTEDGYAHFACPMTLEQWKQARLG